MTYHILCGGILPFIEFFSLDSPLLAAHLLFLGKGGAGTKAPVEH